MAIYAVTNSAVTQALDINQFQQLLTGTMTDQQVTVANRIRASLTGATTASGYVGGVSGAAPASGTFAVGDFAVDQQGPLWVCTTAGTPGTWRATPTQIATQTLNSAASLVTFSGIPSGFNHLLLFSYCRGDTAAIDTNIQMQINNDSASRYQYSFAEFNPSLVTGEFYSSFYVQIGKMGAASATSKMFWTGTTLISNPVGAATNWVTTQSSGFRSHTTSSGGNKIALYGGTYQSTAAVTQVALGAGAGNFVAGSVFTLYGLM